MQVILAAIAKSDGTRKSVTDAVVRGAGITIPADQSILGKEFSIDPTTGDVNRQGHAFDPHEGQRGDVPSRPWPRRADDARATGKRRGWPG